MHLKIADDTHCNDVVVGFNVGVVYVVFAVEILVDIHPVPVVRKIGLS